MASLYITEFVSQGRDGAGYLNQNGIPFEPPLAEQKIAIGGSSTQAAVFQTATSMVRVHTDAICSIAVGLNPTAAATNRRLAANTTEYLSIPPGLGYQVAVITNS